MQSGRAELAELRPLVFAAKHGRAHQSTRKTEIFIFLRLAFWGGACWLRMTSGHDKPEYQDDPEHPGDHRRKRMREPLATPRANANISKESADFVVERRTGLTCAVSPTPPVTGGTA